MRILTLAALLVFGSCAWAQSSLGTSMKPHFQRLSNLGLLGSAPPQKPATTEATGQLPEPVITDPQVPGSSSDREIHIIRAPKQKIIGNLVLLSGGVHVRFRGYDISADSLRGDLSTKIFTLEGEAQLIGQDAIITASQLTINFEDNSYTVSEHKAVLHPGLLKGNTLDDVFLRAASGTGEKGLYTTQNGSFTTCELDVPHYTIESRDLELRPEKRIVLRDTRIRILGRSWLRIPYLAIPLDTRRDRYTPVLGQSRDEGYFIKTLWAVPLQGRRDLDVNLDYFTKLGVGLGGRFRFAGEAHTGFLKLYGLLGNNPTAEAVAGYRQYFGGNLFTIESNLQQRNYLNAPDNTFLSTRASFLIPRGPNTTRLSYFQTSNKSSSFESSAQTVGLSDERRFNERTRWALAVNWVQNLSKFSSGADVRREHVELKFRGSHDSKKYITELEYQRTIPVGDTKNFFSAADRTPVLAIRTDSNRLFGSSRNRPFSFISELSIGEFANSSTSSHISRASFRIDVAKPEVTTAATSLGYSLNFRQSIYGDNTAQYSVIGNTSFRHQIDDSVTFNLRYNYSKPTGFSPLSFDRIGQSNQSSADLSYRPNHAFSMGLQSGYDFRYEQNNLQTPWQILSVRTEYRPSDQFMARGLSTYDPTLRKWTNQRLDISLERGSTFYGLGARYDGVRGTWGNLNLFVDGLRLGKLSASVLLNYNGYTKRFDTKQYSLIYDLHCTEAILQVLENNVGFRAGTQVYFFLRIKAIPFSTPFGTGTQGQPIGIGTGF